MTKNRQTLTGLS